MVMRAAADGFDRGVPRECAARFVIVEQRDPLSQSELCLASRLMSGLLGIRGREAESTGCYLKSQKICTERLLSID